MKPMAIIAGVVAGLIGAAVWAAIAYFANMEVGFVAWGIGLIVGVAAASRGEADEVAGIAAALIALGAVMLGKYGAVHYAASNVMTHVVAEFQVTDQMAQRTIANDLVYEYSGKGKTLKWPAGMDDRTAKKPEDFPKDLWADTMKRWAALKPDGQAALREKIRTEAVGLVQTKVADAKTKVFWSSFSFFDALWFFLAVGTAYRVGSGSGGGDD
jgi:hypothetical protein